MVLLVDAMAIKHLLLILMQLTATKDLRINSVQNSPMMKMRRGSTAVGRTDSAMDLSESQLKKKKRLARAKERRTTFVLGIVMITFTGETTPDIYYRPTVYLETDLSLRALS